MVKSDFRTEILKTSILPSAKNSSIGFLINPKKDTPIENDQKRM